MELRYDKDRFTPVRDYDAEAARLALGIRGRGGRVKLGDRRSGEPVPSLDLELAPDIPLVLDLELGAVKSRVDLGGLALRRVRYRTGASKTDLRFSRPNPEDCEELQLEAGAAALRVWSIGNANCRQVRFNGGVGDVTLDFSELSGEMVAGLNVAFGTLTLMLPRDAGVSVRVTRFLASFERTGFVKRGDTYYARIDTSTDGSRSMCAPPSAASTSSGRAPAARLRRWTGRLPSTSTPRVAPSASSALASRTATSTVPPEPTNATGSPVATSAKVRRSTKS